MAVLDVATWRPVRSHGDVMRKQLGLVLHVQAGPNSPFTWFSDPDHDASSHWWVSKRGVIEQYVDTDVASWAQQDGNHLYLSVETEGYPNDPLTDAQVAALAKIYAWGVRTYGWPLRLAEKPGDTGLGWHGMGGDAWGGHTGCPGNARKAQRQAVLGLARQLLVPPSPPATPTKEHVMSIAVEPVGTASMQGNTEGGWVWGARGHVYGFGAAASRNYGGWDDKTRDGDRRCVALVPTFTDRGYWLVSNLGEFYAYGDAPSIANYQYEPFPIIGAYRNNHIPGVGGVTLIRDDGSHLNEYALPV